jgi:hypothetical protein
MKVAPYTVACHEAGHAVVAWRLGLPPQDLRIQWKNGDETWSGDAGEPTPAAKELPPLDQAAIYAGGIEAQKLDRCPIEGLAWQADRDLVNIFNVFAAHGVHEIADLDERRLAAHARARELLLPCLDQLQAIAAELAASGRVSPDRVSELLGSCPPAPATT